MDAPGNPHQDVAVHQVHDGVDHLHAGNQEQNAGGQRDLGRLPELEDDGAGRDPDGIENFGSSFTFHWVCPPFLVVDPLFLAPELNGRDHQNHRHQHPGLGAGIAEFIGCKGVGVNFRHQAGGIAAGAHDVDGREGFEGGDQTDDAQVEGGGAQHGQGDLEELLALGSAVHLRRLVKLPGDVLQGGHIYDQVKTNTGVHHDADNGYFTECGVCQPLGDLLDPKRGQDQVDGSVAAEQEAEHGRQGYHTGNIGHEEAEPVEETQTGTIEEELQKIADAEPAEPEEEIFDMEEAEDFLEDSPAEDWEDDTESFEEADAEELSFEEILSDWDSEEAEALLEDAEEEVYDESVEETYEEEPDEEPNEEPDEDEAEDILEGAEEEPIEESAEDVVEADAEEIYEEEPEDEVTEDTPILSPDIQRLIDEIEGAVPAEESLPEEKEIEKAPEEPHENMGEVTESLRLDDLPEEDEDLFEDEDFLESEDEEDEYESYEDDDSEEDEYESYEDDDSEEDEYESYEDDDSEEDEYESYEDDDSEEDEYESYEDDDSEDEYTSYDEDEYEDEIYDDEYEDDDEAYYEESDDDELADDEEFYYEDEEEPDEEPDEEDAPDFEDEFKVDPKHSEEPDDREIPDEDDGIDIMSATTPLSRKETAKLIATGKTSPLPLDEISDALSMDTGFVVHGRYDLETQSGIGTRAGLTEEQKKLFSYFVPVRGMSEQLVDVLEQDKNCTNRKGTSKTGNLLIIGDKGNGKTVLAVDVVKAIQKQREIRQGKVAIVTGESLNKKKIGDIFDKLYGGALIIEKAGKMNEKTVAKLNRAMERDTGELLIVLEEQRKPLDRLLSSNREFRRKFTSRLEVPIFINDELVTFGQTYAQENGYKIDEMGILALYSCIDSLQREDHSVTVAEVKEVMDKAIAHSQKASAKKLVKRVFGRNTDSSDRIILSERDFNI